MGKSVIIIDFVVWIAPNIGPLHQGMSCASKEYVYEKVYEEEEGGTGAMVEYSGGNHIINGNNTQVAAIVQVTSYTICISTCIVLNVL